jgi:hypothetical protein
MTTTQLPAPKPEKAPPVRVLGEKSAYDFYVQYCATNGYPPLSLVNWREVTRAGNHVLTQLLVQEGSLVALPHGLGKLVVFRKLTNFDKPSVDWAMTRRMGKKCYHLNTHSNYFKAFLHWEKITCSFRGSSFYAFRLVRVVKRNISAVMQKPDGYKTYQLKPTATTT